MNILNIFENPQKKQRRDYLTYLVNIALADNIITESEKSTLYRVGHKLGFSHIEIDHFIEKAVKSDFIPPIELSKRFEHVYDLIKMASADGAIDHKEMRLVESFSLRSDFKENEIPELIETIISGIKEGKDEEDLFREYLRRRNIRNK